MQHHSFGLAALVDEVVLPCYRILDLGPLATGTTEAFLELNCSCHIEDLVEYLEESQGAEDPWRLLREHLVPKPATRKFDVVLCWDLFNFFEPEGLNYLLELLAPNLKEGTIFHTMMYTGSVLPERPARFRHLGKFTFETVDDPDYPRATAHRYSTLSLTQALDKVSLRSSVLQREGMRKDVVEHMFEYGQATTQATIKSGGASDASAYFSSANGTPVSLPGVGEALEKARKSPFSNVLDCGPRNGRNVDALQRQVGELFVQDLYTAIDWQRQRGSNFADAVTTALRQCSPPSGLDTILLWDLANFFTPTEITELSHQLVQRLKQGGRLHVVVLKKEQLPMRPAKFEIQADGSVHMAASSVGASAPNVRNVTELIRAMPPMKLVAQGHGKMPDSSFFHELTLQKIG